MCRLVDPQYGAKFRERAEEWLKTEKEDAWTVNLKFYLAESYFEAKAYTKCIELYSELLKSPLGKPAKGVNGEPTDDGVHAVILFNLGMSLFEENEKAAAAVMFHLFSTQYKKDARIQSIPLF